MKLKIKLLIIGIVIVIVGTIFIRSCSKNMVKKMNLDSSIENESFSNVTETENNLGRVIECDENHVGSIVRALVQDAPNYWNSDLISDNFKGKYKCARDIQPEIENLLDVGAGKEILNGKSIISISGLISKEDLGEYNGSIEKVVYYYYDYIINNKNQLDDLIFFHKGISETYTLTGERTDGKKLARENNISELLHFIANPYHDFDFYSTKNYSEEAMPYSETCKIVNRPDLDKLGVPDNSYDEKKGDDVYIVFEYPDWKVTWKVNYKVNDDLFFDYIEYIEVDE